MNLLMALTAAVCPLLLQSQVKFYGRVKSIVYVTCNYFLMVPATSHLFNDRGGESIAPLTLVDNKRKEVVMHQKVVVFSLSLPTLIVNCVLPLQFHSAQWIIYPDRFATFVLFYSSL